MGDLDENSRETIELVNDINECVSKKRLDDMMYYFIRVYNQLSEEIIIKTKLDLLEKDVKKFLLNSDYMNRLELFYKISDSTDEGRILLDPSVDDEPIYNLKSYFIKDNNKKDVDLYSFILKNKLRIITHLAKAKSFIISSTGLDMSW